MCLGVPGEILSIEDRADGLSMGRVGFGGIVKEVCLAYVPEATVGDFVVVHVGFALTCMDREEAERTLAFLAEMDELGELDIPQPG